MSLNHFNQTQAHHLSFLLHQWRSGNAQKWKTGGVRFKPRSRLSTYPFGDFRSFLRSSRKYGLGCLRKTPTEGAPPVVPGPTSRQLDSNLHPSIHFSLLVYNSITNFEIRDFPFYFLRSCTCRYEKQRRYC